MQIYTALIGNRDKLHRLPLNLSGVCFTNNKIKSNRSWEIRAAQIFIESNRKTARWYKTSGPQLFSGADIIIWKDCSVQFIHPLSHYLEYLDGDICTMKHPVRHCIYDEAAVCIQSKLDSIERIEAQVNFLKQEKYPLNYGLSETCLLIYHNNERMRNFMREWWELINKYSIRDQLSFDYLIWRRQINLGRIPHGEIRQIKQRGPY
jgi:hypothetical protein